MVIALFKAQTSIIKVIKNYVKIKSTSTSTSTCTSTFVIVGYGRKSHKNGVKLNICDQN